MTTAVIMDMGIIREYARIAAVVDGHARDENEDALLSFATAKHGQCEAIQMHAGKHLIRLHSAKGDDGALDGLRHIATNWEFAQATRDDAGLKLIDMHSHGRDMDFHAIKWLAINERCTPVTRDTAGTKLINFYATCGDVSGMRNGLDSIANDTCFTSATRQAARNRLDAFGLARKHSEEARALDKRHPQDLRPAARRISN